MAVEISEWLVANLEMIGPGLLASDEEVRAFRAQLPNEVGRERQLDTGGTIVSTKFHLHKERITIETTPERSSITKEYPDIHWPDFPNIASLAIGHSSKLDAQEHGYNVAFVYDQKSRSTANQYIAERALLSSWMEGWSIFGGSVELRFHDDNAKRRWTVQLAPRFDQHDTTKIYFCYESSSTRIAKEGRGRTLRRTCEESSRIIY